MEALPFAEFALRGTREIRDNAQIIRLTGILDSLATPKFLEVLNKCFEEGPGNLIIDLSSVSLMDSSGLGALVQLAKKAKSERGLLQIVPGNNSLIKQMFKQAGLELTLMLQPSLDAALDRVE